MTHSHTLAYVLQAGGPLLRQRPSLHAAPPSAVTTPEFEAFQLGIDAAVANGNGTDATTSAHRRQRSWLSGVTLGWSKPPRARSMPANGGDLDALALPNGAAEGQGAAAEGQGAAAPDVDTLEVEPPAVLPPSTRGITNIGEVLDLYVQKIMNASTPVLL